MAFCHQIAVDLGFDMLFQDQAAVLHIDAAGSKGLPDIPVPFQDFFRIRQALFKLCQEIMDDIGQDLVLFRHIGVFFPEQGDKFLVIRIQPVFQSQGTQQDPEVILHVVSPEILDLHSHICIVKHDEVQGSVHQLPGIDKDIGLFQGIVDPEQPVQHRLLPVRNSIVVRQRAPHGHHDPVAAHLEGKLVEMHTDIPRGAQQ